MHRLLERQIKRYLGSLEGVPKPVQKLLAAIDEYYQQADVERKMLERSMELTSQELFERNQQLLKDISKKQNAEQTLQHNTKRLETLRELDRAILAAQSPGDIALVALSRLRELIGCQRVSVVVIEGLARVGRSNDEAAKGIDQVVSQTYSLKNLAVVGKLRKGEVHLVNDLHDTETPEQADQMLLEQGVRSFASVPLIADDELIGALNLASETPAAFQEDEIEVAREVADLLAVAIRQATLFEQVQQLNETLERRIRIRTAQLERRAQEITRLNEMGELLQSCINQEDAYNVVIDKIPEIFPGLSGALGLINESGNLIEYKAVWGDLGDHDVFPRMDCWAMRRGRLHLVENVRPGLLCQHTIQDGGHSPQATLCIPMSAQGEVFGLFYLRSDHQSQVMDGTYLDEDGVGITPSKQRLAMTTSEQIGLALSNLLLREKLRSQAMRDPLTGLYNRRYMKESLMRETRRVARSGEGLGIIMMDVDTFKDVNDRYGHVAGDTLLKRLASFLQSQVRIEDIACRFGGDEFTLILPGISLEALLQRAELIRKNVKNIYTEHDGRTLGDLRLSLGVGIFPQHGSTGEEVLQAADEALYRAKTLGRDRVEVAQGKSPSEPEADE